MAGNEIITALDDIHAALVAGAIAAIGPLTARIETLLGDVSNVSSDHLALIRARAARNATTLTAAMQGVRAAQRRLADLREAASGHRTYARDGQRTTVAGQPGTLRQRV